MSSAFKKAQKSGRRQYKERSQLSGRTHLGHLEKHKDYVKRAKNFHKKQDRLKALKEKASLRNPDEFYFGMINKKTDKGVHVLERNNNLSGDMHKLVNSQDLKYVNLMENVERKKIDKLSQNLHMLDENSSNKDHVIFLESKKEVKKFDAAKHFDTDASLINRSFNRPKKETLRTQAVVATGTKRAIEKQKQLAYKTLSKRLDRLDVLSDARQEIQMQKHLMGKGTRKKMGVDKNKNAVFKWKNIRKR